MVVGLLLAATAEDNMGYCITQTESKFTILLEKQAPALKATKALAKEKDNFHWVNATDFNRAKNIGEVLEAWFYDPEFDEAGNITGVNFSAEKLGADKELFDAIAPFVEKGSFIEMNGEDGTTWRWIFNGTTCEEVYPTITWD